MTMSCLLVSSIATGATITVRKDGTGDDVVIQQTLVVAAECHTGPIDPG
jgi:hypothetical protein